MNETTDRKYQQLGELESDTTESWTETWKTAVYDDVEYDDFEASTLSRIRNLKTRKLVKQHKRPDGYMACKLSKNRKQKDVRVHRVIAFTFLANPENKQFVNHLNSKRADNRLENLAWCTHPENIRHTFTNPDRRTPRTKIILFENDRVTPSKIYDSICSAAQILGIPEAGINDVLAGRCKSTGKQRYYFEYVDPKLILTDDELTEFEDTVEFPSKYMISRDGRVYSKTSKTVIPGSVEGGYRYVKCNRKRRYVHRLVAQKFIPNPNNKKCVNHKDGNKLNNHVDNLEWATVAENTQHAVDMGLTTNLTPVNQYDCEGTLVAKHKSIADACRANKFDIKKCEGNIAQCCQHKQNVAYNFIWRYVHDTTPVVPVINNYGAFINRYDFNGILVGQYKSIADACREVPELDLNCATGIAKCCKYQQKSAYKSIWRYARDTTPVIPISTN
jgi:HNH endonuclease